MYKHQHKQHQNHLDITHSSVSDREEKSMFGPGCYKNHYLRCLVLPLESESCGSAMHGVSKVYKNACPNMADRHIAERRNVADINSALPDATFLG